MTKPSARVRQLHQKFRVPTVEKEPFWQPEDLIDMETVWPANSVVDTRTSEEWSAYCKCPFDSDIGYTEYVSELAKIAVTYSDYMKRTNSNGKSACTILKNGASRTHFEALQNSSRLLARVGPKGFRLGTGTMRNEQVHRKLKFWLSNICQSHRGRLQIGFRVFELAKLLTHSSTAYSPTLTQTSQQRLLSILAGKMRQTSFLTSNSARDPSIVRESLQTASGVMDESAVLSRDNRRLTNSSYWKKRKKPERNRGYSSTDIFKRPRLKNP